MLATGLALHLGLTGFSRILAIDPIVTAVVGGSCAQSILAHGLCHWAIDFRQCAKSIALKGYR